MPPAGSGVLEAPPPRFSAEEVAAIARDVFGLGGPVTDLGSERDQTFAVGRAVLKISNAAEDAAVLDLEARAIEHILRVDPSLPVARPLPPVDGAAPASVEGPDVRHFVRAFERRNGRAVAGSELDDDAVRRFGAAHARLNRALRGFFHPAAHRGLLWNLAEAARLRPLLGSIADGARRALVERVLERYDRLVATRWAGLRAHVVHGDFTLDNVLLDDAGRISAIVDFGDLSFSAEAADVAIGITSLLRGRPAEDVYRTARIALDGYASVTPLEPDELMLLGDLVAARLATLITISAWRVTRFPENAEYIQAWDAGSWQLLGQFDADGFDAVARELGAEAAPTRTSELARRRRAALGSALTGLTYRQPVHVVRGEGVWLYEAGGGRLLDAYNNVPVVGHCHPRVTEAVVRQTRLLNTHARYLYEPLVELAERLRASMPAGSGLDTVMLVNSGSEANEVAWRVALAATGRTEALVSRHAYHGATAAVADLSPEEWAAGYRPPHVRTFLPGDAAGALEGLAATFADTAFTSDGIVVPPQAQLAELVEQTHAAGGLFVADEVQAGHGRTGEHLWSFAGLGLTPDVVTLGKPMGNGYPVAAVVARSELVDRFAETTDFFSTFGGNPVAAQAALAVLDVIEDERLVERARDVGGALRGAIRALEHEAIRDVRGRGLLVGVELPDAGIAERVVDAMRDAGVLIGRTGPGENVLKIRPPLVFGDEHVDIVTAALGRALAGI